MSVVCNTRYSTKAFDFISELNEFCAEISSLRSGLGRVYDDACDEGLVLVSHVTNQERVFAVDEIETDREDEVVGWRLKCVSHNENFTVFILND